MSLKFFIIAGEASGDYIGAQLIKQLKLINPHHQFYGVGGRLMKEEGLLSLFDISHISHIGLLEILPHVKKILDLINLTVTNIIDVKPDVLITIDSPGFCHRVVKGVRKSKLNIKIINYVAPSVWAYKRNRVHKIAALYDHQLLILPMEKPYFDAINFPSTYVGFPALEKPVYKSNIDLRQKYGIQNTLITIMPGSRRGELNRHIPIIKEALKLLKNKIKFTIFIPTFKEFGLDLKSQFSDFSCIISSDLEVKAELLSITNIGLIKSGTATINAMHNLIPSVVIYKVSPLTAFVFKFFMKTKYFALPNIIINHQIMPELIQHNCTYMNIYNALYKLIESKPRQLEQKVMFQQILDQLIMDIPPSKLAAQVILNILRT